MDITELMDWVPKDKSDGARLFHFDGLTDEEIAPALEEIFSWTADMNWPVADKCRDIIIAHQSAAMPYIKEVMTGRDAEWQYFIITELVPGLTPENRLLIKEDIARIPEFFPGEYGECAMEALEKFF